MNSTEIETVLREELRRIAPDIDIDDINQNGELREEMDIDSMDFLNLVTALGKRLNLAMPEADYARMVTFSDMLNYLQSRPQSQ
ncbi:MAG: acyl carrier protein [Rhodobacteraceae bacterium]|nr:acyl carrier protein [Paracoccaceae bacterium]